MKSFFCLFILSTVFLVSCKQTKEYYVFDDKKDANDPEYKRIFNRHQKKKQQEVLKETAKLRLNYDKTFEATLDKYYFELKVTEDSKEKRGFIFLKLFASDTLRVILDNREGSLRICPGQVCQFDYTLKNQRDFFDALIAAEVNNQVELLKIRDDSMEVQTKGFEYIVDDKTKIKTEVLNYYFNAKYPFILNEYNKVFKSKHYVDNKEDKAKENNIKIEYIKKTIENELVDLEQAKNLTSYFCTINFNTTLAKPTVSFKENFIWTLSNCVVSSN